jgi:hypothetical protein
MANLKFYELQRLRKSAWDTPRFVRGYDLTLDHRLVLPRGLRHPVTRMIEQAGSRLALTDVRNPGREIEVAFAADLDPTQTSAVNALLAHDDRVLVAPPGSGKSVMACAVIAERATSTLVLVDRKALAEQWRAQIERLLGVRPGQLGGGRTKLSGVVDVVMLPSLARRADVAEPTSGYGHVVVDECHHLAAAAYDHSVRRIGAQFWLGLTATPNRRDRLGELVTWQLGPVPHTPCPVSRERWRKPLPMSADRGGCCRCTRPDSATTTLSRPRLLSSPACTGPSASTRIATRRSSATSPRPWAGAGTISC